MATLEPPEDGMDHDVVDKIEELAAVVAVEVDDEEEMVGLPENEVVVDVWRVDWEEETGLDELWELERSETV